MFALAQRTADIYGFQCDHVSYFPFNKFVQDQM